MCRDHERKSENCNHATSGRSENIRVGDVTTCIVLHQAGFLSCLPVRAAAGVGQGWSDCHSGCSIDAIMSSTWPWVFSPAGSCDWVPAVLQSCYKEGHGPGHRLLICQRLCAVRGRELHPGVRHPPRKSAQAPPQGPKGEVPPMGMVV